VLGYKHLHQEAQAPGNRFVVLVTDGADSCLSEYTAAGVVGDPVAQLLDTEVPKAVSVNIRTFVIGAPGSEPARGLLSKIAFAGGTGKDPSCDHSDNPVAGSECHLDMTRSTDFAQDLTDALAKITGSAAMTCEFDVPVSTDGSAVDPNTVNVDYYPTGNVEDPSTRQSIYKYANETVPCEGGPDGWKYNADGTKIVLCGAICDTVRSGTSGQVVVSLGCPQLIR
jgi:hypothetical protein